MFHGSSASLASASASPFPSSISIGMSSAASLSISNVLSAATVASSAVSNGASLLAGSPRNHKANTTTTSVSSSSHSLPSSADLPSAYGHQLGYYGSSGTGGEYYHHPAMYHHGSTANAMENWHHPYNPLGHFYRGYEAAAAMADWPMVHHATHNSSQAVSANHEHLNGSASDLLNSGLSDPYGYHQRLSSDPALAGSPGSPPEYKNPRDLVEQRHLLHSEDVVSGGSRLAQEIMSQHSLNNANLTPSSGNVGGSVLSRSPGEDSAYSPAKCDGRDSPDSGKNESLLHGRPMQAASPYKWLDRAGYQPRIGTKEGGNLLSHSSRTRTKDKYRVVYSDHQRLELEKEFHYSRYITIRRKAELAQALNLSERQVKIWFQNRRAKERKHMKKRDEIIQKEKLDAASSLHAVSAAAGHHAAAAVAASAPHMFAMGSMGHMLHPGMAPHL